MSKRKEYIKDILTIIMLGIMIQLFGAFILRIIFYYSPVLSDRYDAEVANLFVIDSKVIIYSAFIAPIVEEVAFRLGLIYLPLNMLKKGKISANKPYVSSYKLPVPKDNTINGSFGVNEARIKMVAWVLIIASSILFGIYHGKVIQGTYAAITGLFFGYLMYRKMSLLLNILLHMVVNVSGLLVQVVFPTAPRIPICFMFAALGAVGVVACSAVLFKVSETPLSQ